MWGREENAFRRTKVNHTLRALMPVGKPILVDLANVSQVDSVDIGTFVSVWASARKSGCELKQSSWLVVVVIVVTTHTLLR